MLHYVIIATIILVIVYKQRKYYRDTRQRIDVFRTIFPKNCDYQYYSSDRDEGVLDNSFCGILSDHDNGIFNEIIRSINAYLKTNKGRVSDYHLMKDIVDRNCDTAEEEIDSQVPVPLYLGLMGTMAGILVGIGYLWISGDLNTLLDAKSTSSESGAEGVQALLGGVALAMISSIMGILLTTRGSMLLKDAKAEVQSQKHSFLSWMQANMLPHLTNDTAQVLERMTRNLTNFNQEFYGNTKKLGAALSQVYETTKVQAQLIESINQLDNKRVVKQNLELYTALRNSTEEIGRLAELLNNSTEYLNAVRSLNERLDMGERRNEAIERMAEFFEAETQQIEQRKVAMTYSIGKIDSALETGLRQLGQHANSNLESFYTALGKQQDALQQKLGETETLIQEIKNLSPIKDGISKFERATRDQNARIDALSNAIRQLVEVKTGVKESSIEIPSKKPFLWYARKFALIAAIVLVGLLILAILVANWEDIYQLLHLFKF